MYKLDKFIKNIKKTALFNADYDKIVYENLNSSKDHSIAIVDIPPGKMSLKHFHPVAEESYYMVSGTLKVVINGEPKFLNPGDTIFIPTKAVHQLFNLSEENARLVVTCTPRWTFDGSVPVKDDKQQTSTSWQKQNIVIYNKTNLVKIEKGNANVYELLEKSGSKQHSLALVELSKHSSLLKHYQHKKKDEYYVILGDRIEGFIIMNNVTHDFSAGDVITVPAYVQSEIFNTGDEALCFLVTCADAQAYIKTLVNKQHDTNDSKDDNQPGGTTPNCCIIS